MDLFTKKSRDISEGISVLRKEGTSLFLKTMREADMLKYRFDMYKIHGHLSELYRELGERFIEAAEKKDYNVFSKDEVKDIIEKIENIRIEEDKCKREIDSLLDLEKDQGG